MTPKEKQQKKVFKQTMLRLFKNSNFVMQTDIQCYNEELKPLFSEFCKEMKIQLRCGRGMVCLFNVEGEALDAKEVKQLIDSF